MQILQWWQMKSRQITRKSGHRCASLICITWISSIACITYTTEISHQMILWDDIDIDLKMNQVANLRTLWCAFYKPKWCVGVPKFTKMRYVIVHNCTSLFNCLSTTPLLSEWWFSRSGHMYLQQAGMDIDPTFNCWQKSGVKRLWEPTYFNSLLSILLCSGFA